jgi:hypothetical protein
MRTVAGPGAGGEAEFRDGGRRTGLSVHHFKSRDDCRLVYSPFTFTAQIHYTLQTASILQMSHRSRLHLHHLHRLQQGSAMT